MISLNLEKVLKVQMILPNDGNHAMTSSNLSEQPVGHINGLFYPKQRQQRLGIVFHDFEFFHRANHHVELDTLSRTQW